MQKQQGFTLIELVMDIVILGILAATALPKFANLQVDARKASLSSAEGAVKSAAAIAHAKFLIDSTTVKIEGTTVAYTNGYPTAATIGPIAGLSDDYTVTVKDAVATIQVNKSAKCQFTYTEAAANSAPTYVVADTCD